MEGKKYELTDETKTIIVEGKEHILHRIIALKDFGGVQEGKLGGFIEKEENLSHEGDCWVYGYAMVFDDAMVFGDAKVFGNALVYGEAQVTDKAKVYGNAGVWGYANVYGNAKVFDFARVSGNAKVYGNALVDGRALVYGNAEISEGNIYRGTINGKEKKSIELE